LGAHGLEVGTCAALAFPELAHYVRWPLLVFAWGAALLLMPTMWFASWIITMRNDQRLRISHGVEHATVDLLALQGAPVTQGTAHADHFVLSLERDDHFDVWLARVRETTEIAIARYASGDTALAYAHTCGTSTQLAFLLRLAAVAVPGVALHLLGAPAHFMLLAWLLAVRTSQAIDKPLGILAQRWFTVSTEFESVAVGEVLSSETEETFEVRVMLDIVPRAT
jgi:hypothetical protein